MLFRYDRYYQGGFVQIVIIGLSITSIWDNGHAALYRALVAGLAQAGQDVLFLEQDHPSYRATRDLPNPSFCRVALYTGTDELIDQHGRAIADADLVIVGSYISDGLAISRLVQERARGLRAFYDIDTPITLAAMAHGRCDYITPDLVSGFDLYLSTTGGPTLGVIERRFGAKMARALYCSVDPGLNSPDPDTPPDYDLGYVGLYAPDRQPTLDRLLCDPARAWPAGRFSVVGPGYPPAIEWPTNILRVDHIPSSQVRDFYRSHRYALNVTRADTIRAGFSPGLRLFEAAACGSPIISDWWPGLETLFRPGVEIVVARTAQDVMDVLRDPSEERRLIMAGHARARILQSHSGRHRAADLLSYVREANG
jgi:spore maturation protein CgeB